MDIDTFRKGKQKIRAGWPEDRIISEDQNQITVQCENGAYLRYSRFECPEFQQLHGKVMVQFTEDLKAKTFNNVTRELAGMSEAKGRVKESLKEFAYFQNKNR